MKKILAAAFAIFIFIGCVKNQVTAAEETAPAVAAASQGAPAVIAVSVEVSQESPLEENPDQQLVQLPLFALCPPEARPGEPFTVGYSDDFVAGAGRNLEAALIDSRGRRLTKAAFFSLRAMEPIEITGNGELRTAILAVPSTALPGNAVIRIESADGIVRELPFIISERNFASETIHLDQGNTDLRTLPDPQKTQESEALWALLSRTGTDIFYGGEFTPPLTSTRRTSHYGDRRVYQYVNGTSDTSIHAGVDYGVPTGTEVKACAAGKVAFAGPRIVTGNSVILEHLPGVYSLYYHLDAVAVSRGDMLEAGALLGQSGSTGLATGPHLHWEIRVSGENADPDAFMARAVLDKKDILNKLTNY